MNTNQPTLTGHLSFFVRYMLIVLLICMMPIAYAQDAKQICELVEGEEPAEGSPMFFYRWQPPEEKDSKANESTGDDEQKAAEPATTESATAEPATTNAEPVAAESATVKPVATKPANNQLSDAIQNKLKTIEGKAYPNKFLFKQALATLFAGSCTLLTTDDNLNKILQQARNEPEKDWNPIQLSGDGCGCSRDFSSLVYGFYPYWLATQDVQVIDFSLFDRIGFYAISLNQKGEFQDYLQWNQYAADFITEAHKHRVEVDVTLYLSNWQNWLEKDIDKAAKKVEKAVTDKFQSSDTNVLRTILPFVDDTPSVTVDGVTLYFDNYKTSSDSSEISENIVKIVDKVAEKLKDSETRLNIMLGLNMENLQKSLLKDEKEKNEELPPLTQLLLDDKISHIFIFLPEPTTNSKKELRQIIENAYSGRNSKKMLRKMVPIISPLGHENDPRGPFVQFIDDLIYFDDNFAGVGFWPLPLNTDNKWKISDTEEKSIKEMLIEEYQVKNGSNYLKEKIDDYVPQLCQFVCPNRDWIGISLALVAGLLVLYALFAIWNCRLRELYQQYILYFMAVGLATGFIFFISLICDPLWADKADFFIIIAFLVSLVAIIWRNVKKANQSPQP